MGNSLGAKLDNKESVKRHFNDIASTYDYWKKKNDYYYSLLKKFYNKNIPVGSSVVEFGCATGDILASCKPKKGLGIDISTNIITVAKNKYPDYEFITADVESFSSTEKFDYCLMSDLIDHLSNIPLAIETAYKVLNPEGKLVITTINPLWNPLFLLLEKLKLKMPEGVHCFLPNRFIEFFCRMKGFQTISKGALIFIPKRIPLVAGMLNNAIPRLPILNRFCWVQTLIVQKTQLVDQRFGYSIIIPVFNEEKNIQECINRIPKPNRDYEVVVIDDGSEDATGKILHKLQEEMHNLKVIRFAQNRGKAYAIEEGIRCAKKDILIILDADMSVAPEDILLFVEPLEKGLVDFVNGTRLIYNMEKNAMNQLKLIANFLLALLFSLMIKLRITDALCGTKAFFRKDFLGVKISEERWGDLVLLWTAKIKGLRIGEVPIRYYARKSGHSKMRFFSDGMKFMIYTAKMALKGLFKFNKNLIFYIFP